MPDAQMTVLLRTRSEEWPIQIGFRDDGVWLDAAELLINDEVIGWMELEAAAGLLDGRPA